MGAGASDQRHVRRGEPRRALHGEPVGGVGDPDEGPRLPLSGGNQVTTYPTDVRRRGLLPSAVVAAAAAFGLGRFAPRAAANENHIRLYVEMDVAPSREREILDTFHRIFVPEA